MNRILILFFGIMACSPTQQRLEGLWRAELAIQGQLLPFQIEFEPDKAFIINGKERLKLDSLIRRGDSVWIDLLTFNSRLRFKIGQHLVGVWERLGETEPYQVPFTAQKTNAPRFAFHAPVAFAGKFRVSFLRPDGSVLPAIGLFQTVGDECLGTFMTASGDFRYLAGVAEGDSLRLSCFDGTHAYLFKAKISGDSLTQGVFWSGKSRKINWFGVRDSLFTLPLADTITYLRDKTQKFTFSFPLPDGSMLSPDAPQYSGKVRIIQILGSWCPNCMDETRFLGDFDRKYRRKGLQIMGLAFENRAEMAFAAPLIQKVKSKYAADYPIALAGTPKEASSVLPMLNKVAAFPTTIFLDKKGEVRRIHTGFSGPATGVYYQELTEDFTLFVEKLLNE